MKFFKMTLLTIATTALLLQGCGSDDSDESASSETPTQPDFNKAIVGFWNSDNPEDNLTTVGFFDDGTYVVAQVDDDDLLDELAEIFEKRFEELFDEE